MQENTQGKSLEGTSDHGGGFLSLGINDSKNVVEEEIKIDEDAIKGINITPEIKLGIGVIFLIGVGFSIYVKSLSGMLIWIIAIGFTMEVMGVFDNFNKEIKQIKKPSGYENIE